MIKIPTLFVRNPERMSEVLPDLNPGCEWVVGEGQATQKMDGTATMIDGDGGVWKRRTLKRGDAAPPRFVLCSHDQNTGKRFGWVPVEKEDRWHMEALSDLLVRREGTYELIGPKIQGNPEGEAVHRLVAHSARPLSGVPTDFDDLRRWLAGKDIEGVVWHHPDGRMAKIKLRDFGLKRGERA